MSVKICWHPCPDYDARCIRVKGHPKKHLYATPEAVSKVLDEGVGAAERVIRCAEAKLEEEL